MSKNAGGADDAPLAHQTIVALTRSPAAEVDAGTDIVLKVMVSCAHGCDLRGQIINVMAPDGAVVAGSGLADFAGNANETTEFAFTAPEEVGEYSWSLVFPKHEAEGVIHEQGSLPITVTTLAHDTSLAVWGVPSPIVIDHSFRIHVGATCSSGCDLRAGDRDLRRNRQQHRARELGETPWEEPARFIGRRSTWLLPAGRCDSRSIRFAPTELRLPGGASARSARDRQAAAAFGERQGRAEGRRHACRDAQVRLGGTSPLLTRPASRGGDTPRNLWPGRAQDRL